MNETHPPFISALEKVLGTSPPVRPKQKMVS
jgi:hypothetical protein